MDEMRQANKVFRETEFQRKKKKALKTRRIASTDIMYLKGDHVLYQTKDRKTWLGPIKIECAPWNEVLVKVNGELKKLGKCRVMPYNTLNVEKC